MPMVSEIAQSFGKNREHGQETCGNGTKLNSLVIKVNRINAVSEGELLKLLIGNLKEFTLF